MPPVVLMGVSGSGKTTVGAALAERFSMPFIEADDLHPKANRDKMTEGIPLTDEDRWPWLNAIADEIERVCRARGHVVVACSALKRTYRDVLLRGRDDVRIVFLNGTQKLIADRLAARKGHFMPPGLLDSQFKTLEPPGLDENVIDVSIDAPVDVIVDDIVSKLGSSPASQHSGTGKQS
jgi:gluconokinase